MENVVKNLCIARLSSSSSLCTCRVGGKVLKPFCIQMRKKGLKVFHSQLFITRCVTRLMFYINQSERKSDLALHSVSVSQSVSQSAVGGECLWVTHKPKTDWLTYEMVGDWKWASHKPHRTHITSRNTLHVIFKDLHFLLYVLNAKFLKEKTAK